MFDRHQGGERVILVTLDFGTPDFAESVAELRLLATGAGLEVLGEVQGKRSRPDAALFAGSGKADEIAALVAAVEADVVIFNHELSPAQEGEWAISEVRLRGGPSGAPSAETGQTRSAPS